MSYAATCEPSVDDLRFAAAVLRAAATEDSGEQLERVAAFLVGRADRHQAADDREVAGVVDPEPFFHAWDPTAKTDGWRVLRLDPLGDPPVIDLGVGFATEAEARADAQLRTDRFRAATEATA